MTNRWIPACVLNADPPVTLSKRMPAAGQGLGLLSLYHSHFAGAPSFHLLALAWTHEHRESCLALRDEIAQLSEKLPQAHYLVLANSAAEARMLNDCGVTALHACSLCLADSDRYKPVSPPEGQPRADAVYVAGFHPFKRHYLASNIQQLLLLSWEPDALEALKLRQTLPQATFANYDAGDGVYKLLHGNDYCAQLSRASTGLCLSAEEGPMRASIEYMLCGLPVVTTAARGGRVEFLDGPYLTTVPPDQAAIEKAVALWCASPPDPADVRAFIQNHITTERERLLEGINTWLASYGLVQLDDRHLGLMIKQGIWRARPLPEILAPLVASA